MTELKEPEKQKEKSLTDFNHLATHF